MRPAGIAIVGFVFLLVTFAGIAYIRLALLGLALLLCLLTAMGFWWQGHKQHSFSIPARLKPDAPTKSIEPGSLRIEGREFRESSLPPRFDFVLQLRNIPLLLALGGISVAVGAFSLVGAPFSLFEPMNSDAARYEFYLLFYLIIAMLFIAGGWALEAAVLREPTIALANVRKKSGSRTRRVEYEFIDSRGGYHGGSTLDFDKRGEDDLKVLFCSAASPDFNKLSCGLMFHKVMWAERDLP